MQMTKKLEKSKRQLKKIKKADRVVELKNIKWQIRN